MRSNAAFYKLPCRDVQGAVFAAQALLERLDGDTLAFLRHIIARSAMLIALYRCEKQGYDVLPSAEVDAVAAALLYRKLYDGRYGLARTHMQQQRYALARRGLIRMLKIRDVWHVELTEKGRLVAEALEKLVNAKSVDEVMHYAT